VTVRRTERRDAAALAELHAAFVPNSLWAELGPGFLRALYAALADDPRFVSFVDERPDGIGGFVAGSTDTGALLRGVARRSAAPLALALALGLRPRHLRRLLGTARYPSARGAVDAGESLFCAVRPELRRQGVAARLHHALEEVLRERGIDRVVVTTEATNAAAQAHLAALGFHREGAFTFYGKPMIRYEKEFGVGSTNPTTEPG
jgi:ribosomal protein S18 acetylase RimI-like enzyme